MAYSKPQAFARPLTAPAKNLCHLRNLREIKTSAPASPAPRGGSGRGPIFFNTEVTDFTEYPPAHFDETDAASRQLMTRNLRTCLTSLLNSATLRALTIQRGACEFFFARRVAEFWEFLLLAKQESTWSGPSYGLGVNGGCARLLQPYLPVPGTKIKTLKVSLRSTIAPASPAPTGRAGEGPHLRKSPSS